MRDDAPSSGEDLTPAATRAARPGDVPTLLDGDATRSSRPTVAAPARGRGTVLGRYILLEPLGSGGMGVVYAAYDPQLDRKVALKLLQHGDDTDNNTAGRARMLREAQAMARLAHPNVVTVHDVGVVDGAVFIAMELVEGTTLTEAMEHGPVPWRQALVLFEAAARGLAAAHDAGLVHRDFKPDNVMIGSDGRVRVTDFGLARLTAEPQAEAEAEADANLAELSAVDRLTRTGAFVGTPAYMAPELLAGGAADFRSDQYAFCVALYRTLYGTRPFAGNSVGALYTAATSRKLEPPRWRVRVPGWLAAAISRGLHPDPDKRFASMADLLATLASGRRRRGRVVVGAGAIAAIAIGITAWTAATRSGCADGHERVAQVWNSATRETIETALETSGLAEPTAIAGRLGAQLDSYSDAWARSFRDACEANLRGEQSSALLDARMSCLEQRKTALQATVNVLGQVDREMAARALEIVEKLAPIATCENAERLLRGRLEPEDEAIHAAVSSLRQRLEQVKALSAAGRYAAALEIAEPMLDEAGALKFVPIAAEIEVEIGELKIGLGQWEEASRALEQACFDAEASGHDDVAAAAWALAVYVDGFKLARREAGDMAARRAEAAALRAGDRPDLMATMLHNRGVVFLVRGEYDKALADHRAALQLRRDHLGERNVATGNSHSSLGNVHFQLGQLDEALASYRQAHEILVESVGTQHPDAVSALENIANVLSAKQKFEEARGALNEALGVLERNLGPDHPRVGQILFNLGWISEQMGEHEGALAYFAKARELELARVAPTHPLVAEYDASMGIVLYKLDRHDEAKRHLESALTTLEAAKGPNHNDVARVLNDLALIENAHDNREGALRLHERALAIRRSALPADHPELVMSLKNISTVLIDLERFADAEPLTKEVLAITEPRIAQDPESYLYAVLLSSEVAAKLGDRQRAIALLERARPSLAGNAKRLARLDKALAEITQPAD